jgi:hypothetical protein
VGKAAAENKEAAEKDNGGDACKEQRGIKFEDIEDAKVKGTVSLAIRFDGEKGRVQVMDEISRWVGRIREEPQFEGIAIGYANAKGRDWDRRMEVELQGSKEHVRELKKWLESKGYFGVPRNRVIYTQKRQQQPVVVVEGQLASPNDEVGIVALFYRNEEGEEVDVEGMGLCSQCGIVIDKNSKDSTYCSFSHTWWSKSKMHAPGRDGNCKNCKRIGEDHRKTRRGKGVYNLCYYPDWAKGYDECCCNCAKDKGWSTSGYEEYGCEQCKNKLRLVKASDGIANLVDITFGHQVDTKGFAENFYTLVYSPLLLDLDADALALDAALTEQGRARIDAASGFWVIGPGTTKYSLSSWPPGKPFLLAAAGQGRANFVERLTRHYGCDVNYLDKTGNTALHLAAYYGHADVVATLLRLNSDLTIKNKYGETALDCGKAGQKAYDKKQFEGPKSLAAKNSCIDLTTRSGWPGWVEIIRLLEAAKRDRETEREREREREARVDKAQ